MNEPLYNGKKLPNVQSVTIDKNSGLIPLPLATNDSSEMMVYDLLGATRTITITGRFIGSVEFRQEGDATYHGVYSIESILNGNQTSTLFLFLDEFGVDGTSSSKDVKITSFNVNSNVGEHFAVWNYTITFVECKTGTG